MKKNHHLLCLSCLLALLLVALVAFVGCDSEVDQPGTTVGDTTAVTDPTGTTAPTAPAESDTTATPEETTAPVGEIDGAALLESILAKEDESTDNEKLEMDLAINVAATVMGVENSMTMPYQLTTITAGKDQSQSGNLAGEVFELCYKDGILYITSEGETVKCAVTPEEYAIIASIMQGGDGEVDDDEPADEDFFLPEGIKVKDAFLSISAEATAESRILITVKGLNPTYASEMVDTFMPLLLSMEMIGVTTEEYDEEALIKETVEILKTLDENNFILTFTVDTLDGLVALGMDITIKTSTTVEGMAMDMKVGIKGTMTYTKGGQIVALPAGASGAPEVNWKELFGMESAEELGLIPDENGIVTLSDDIDLRTRQYYYIITNSANLTEVKFAVTGYAEFAPADEEYAASLMIYLLYEGEPEYESMIVGTVTDDTLAAALAALDTTTTHTFILSCDEFDFIVESIA